MRFLANDGVEEHAVVGDGRSRPEELVAVRIASRRPRKPSDLKAWHRVGRALQREQRGPDEELAADKRRHGVPGQPEHERRAADAERQRLSRLHGDAPEHLLDAEIARGGPDEIVRAHRHAAGGDDDVGRERALERLPMRIWVVLYGVEPHHIGAGGAERSRQHRAVRLVDLPWPERSPRPLQLRTGRQQRNTRRRSAGDARDPDGSERADLRGAERGAAFDHHGAGSDVSASGSNVVPLANGISGRDAVVFHDNDLDRHNRVGTSGNHPARGDRHRLSGPQRAIRGTACGDSRSDRQPPRSVHGTDGKAVHCRARKRR